MLLYVNNIIGLMSTLSHHMQIIISQHWFAYIILLLMGTLLNAFQIELQSIKGALSCRGFLELLLKLAHKELKSAGYVPKDAWFTAKETFRLIGKLLI